MRFPKFKRPRNGAGFAQFDPQARQDRQTILGKHRMQCPGGMLTEVDGVITCVPTSTDNRHRLAIPRYSTGSAGNLQYLQSGKIASRELHRENPNSAWGLI
jgi:hypothetical protein